MARVVRHAVFVRRASAENFAMLAGEGPFGRPIKKKKRKKAKANKPLSGRKKTQKFFKDLAVKLQNADSRYVRRTASNMARARGFEIDELKNGAVRYKLPSCSNCVEVVFGEIKVTIRLLNAKEKVVSTAKVILDYTVSGPQKKSKKGTSAARKANAWAIGKNGLYGNARSIADVDPAAAREWNKSMNKNVSAKSVSAELDLDRWWTCSSCNGDYLMGTKEKLSGGRCPYCSYKEVLSGFNDLATRAPILADELVSDYPEEVLFALDRPKVWECSSCGCVWRATPLERVTNLVQNRTVNDCPACGSLAMKAADSGQLLPDLDISIKAMAPELVSLWRPEDNEGYYPSEIEFMTEEECCWTCSEGHRWFETPRDVVLNNCLCPVCIGEAGWEQDKE